VGSSGAGKSTIVNQLLGMAVQDTQASRESDGRGRHTTTQRELFILPGGGLILDNPGIRELQLWPEDASVEDAFTDIAELAESCTFRDCRHQGDKGCAVQVALSNGALDPARWENFLKLGKEFKHVSRQVDGEAQREHKQRMKKLMKDQKRNYRSSNKDPEG
jgi:ribosome biogenesis GTPase / thiamine phosphate phosphatase